MRRWLAAMVLGVCANFAHTEASDLQTAMALAKNPPHTYECLGVTHLGQLLYSGLVERHGRTYRAMRFDRNFDGRTDLVLIFAQVNAKLFRPFPDFYLIDEDFTGPPYNEYRDQFGNGRCEDIVAAEGNREVRKPA